MALNTGTPATNAASKDQLMQRFANLRSDNNKRISVTDRMLLTERLAMLLETDNPLYNSINMLETQIDNRHLRLALADVRDQINGGVSFAGALSKHPEIFDKTFTNLVAAGERGGFLPEVLQQLYKIDQQRNEMTSMVRQALIYPTFLLFFSIAIVIFILVFVFPKFADMFASLNDNLPTTTVWLMALSDLLSQYWQLLALGFAALLVVGSKLAERERSQVFFDRMKLRIPFIRDIVIQYYLVQTMHVLSMSLRNGLTILDALHGCQDIVKNRTFRHFLIDTANQVEAGDGIATGFQRSKLIPAMVKQMVSTGEQSAKLPFVMLRISQFYEIELQKKIQTASKLVEPIMLLTMGLFVGFLVSSLILPIFQLSRGVN